MCTVSWFTTPKGYELFFNRDESKKRTAALAPEKFSSATVDFLSPTDMQGGGSWVASNQLGITVCLLNLYTNIDLVESEHYLSRGKIIRDIAHLASLREIYQHIAKFDLSLYRTFRVFAIDDSGKNILIVWNGKKLTFEHDTAAPKSSSSVDTQKVVNGRKALFKKIGLQNSTDRAAFFAYQRSHEPNRNYSVCVHRELTQTVSLCHIVVDDQSVSFDYYDGSPCECFEPISQQITRTSIDSQFDVA